jgi:hypothetical protein
LPTSAPCRRPGDELRYLGPPAILLENGVLELKILPAGGPFVDLVLKADPDKLSPLWAPLRAAQEAGGEPRFGSSVGHFVCVDGFGGVSEEERAAGLQNHGEAHRPGQRFVSENGTTTPWCSPSICPSSRDSAHGATNDGENVVYATAI